LIRKKPWLGPEERVLAEKFRELNPLEGEFWPPVSLHTVHTEPYEYVTERFWMGQLLPKMWRIDDICETPTAIWLIEYTSRVRDSAISRLLKYSVEFRRQFKPEKPVKLMLVAHVDDPAYHEYLRQYGIDLMIL